MQHEEYGEVIQLQGDQRQKITDWLTRNQIAKQEQIKVLVSIFVLKLFDFLSSDLFSLALVHRCTGSETRGRGCSQRSASTHSNGPHSDLPPSLVDSFCVFYQSLLHSFHSSATSVPQSSAHTLPRHALLISAAFLRMPAFRSYNVLAGYYRCRHNFCAVFASRESYIALYSTDVQRTRSRT